MHYNSRTGLFHGDGAPRLEPQRPDGTFPNMYNPRARARATAFQNADPARLREDILHVQHQQFVDNALEGVEENDLERTEFCPCDKKWYTAGQMAEAGHECVPPNRGPELGRSVVMPDLISATRMKNVREIVRKHGQSSRWMILPSNNVTATPVAGAADGDLTVMRIPFFGEDTDDEEMMKKRIYFEGVVVRDFGLTRGKYAHCYEL